MKNLFFTVAAVVALTFALSSCKKDRTCTCTYADGDVTKVKFEKVTKKFVRDEADCYERTTTVSSGGVSFPASTVKCKID